MSEHSAHQAAPAAAAADTIRPPTSPVLHPLPPLLRDVAFWGMTATQFLGAFNDNLFKQALLLLFEKVRLGSGERDLQWLGTLVFSLPFVLFSGYAGYLSDRYSKRTVIIASKWAEIAIMAAGAVIFLIHVRIGLTLSVLTLFSIVLCCMGAQSAFFGPGKYGILPELFRDRDLPQANGLILMTTFLAIIFGSACAGMFFPSWLWALGACCIVVAAVGTRTSYLVRPVPRGSPHLRFEWTALGISRETRLMLGRDGALLQALLASSVFWLVAAMVQMTVISVGKSQLRQNDLWTSVLTAAVSIGIATGSLIAGAASRNRFNTRVLKTGLWGMVLTLAALSADGPHGQPHLLGYWGCLLALIVLGGFTGMFAVPLQVFLQSRPPAGEKGRMIAAQNLCNWIGIVCSAGLYWLADQALTRYDWPRSYAFGFTAALLLLVAVLYHPQDAELIDQELN